MSLGTHVVLEDSNTVDRIGDRVDEFSNVRCDVVVLICNELNVCGRA
jgi:hypothetical protein